MRCSSFTFNIAAHFFFVFFNTFSFAADSIGLFGSISDGRTLVSREGVFELGFFSPGNSKNRYVGIWYKNIPVQTVVWVANRCSPINDSSGLLTINSTGNLVLSKQNKNVVWSTNSSKQAKKPIVELLDSGNLVLRDEEDRSSENYLWQSFDYPSDTVLPGMKFGWDLRTGVKRSMTAWKNTEDPCPGDLRWGTQFDVQHHRVPEACLWKGERKIYRTGPWDGISSSGTPESRPNPIYDSKFVHNDDEVYYMFNLKNKSVLTRLVINQTLSSRVRLIWMESDKTWRYYSSLPSDTCDNYGVCGGNGYCIISENPVCQCLKGFRPRNEGKWNSADWSEGCVRDSPLSCKDKDNDGFLKLVGIKLPDTEQSWTNRSMNVKECKAKCLSNCSCVAYATYNIEEGSGCITWFGDLFDIRKFTSGGRDLYIRMPPSELAGGDHSVNAAIVAPVVGVGFLMILGIGYYIWRVLLKGKHVKPTKQYGSQEEDLELPLFDLCTITTATNNFSKSNLLGQGGFGSVYRGKLLDGREIAVKRLSMSSGQGVNEFKNEVTLISKLQHRNLVRILGCCIQGEEKLLIYEYMPKKSLDSFIFDQLQGKLLGWPTRFQIICGIARGLMYLHQDSRLRIIHRDLKASNILLDNEMNPKISDFGMARIFGGDQIEAKTRRVVGTYGYMAPEYAFNGVFSTKSDVFSFGIVLLEIISGKKSTGFRPQKDGLTLSGFAWTLMQQDRTMEFFDACISNSHHNLQEVLRCVHVGLLCVQQHSLDRPSMSSVVVMLTSDSHVLPQPQKPGYFMGIESPPRGYPESSLTNDLTMSAAEAR